MTRRHLLFLRPGALGDVLLLRAALGYARGLWPECRITLLAPGARGRLLHAPGRLADTILDSDRAQAAWLFADDGGEPPACVRQAAAGCDLALVYLDSAGEVVTRNLLRLGCRKALAHPSRPAAGAAPHAQEHLCLPLARYATQRPQARDERALLAKALRAPPPITTDPGSFPAAFRRAGLQAGTFAVLHPGSGSPRKNWPLASFAVVGRALSRRLRVVVTAGEADGARGRELAREITGALLCERLPLAGLAAMLAEARLYLGNDSGVSHLAAAVRRTGEPPACVVVFGPTRPETWAPPGCTVVRAPRGELGAMRPDTVMEACLEELER